MAFDDCPALRKAHKSVVPTLQLTNSKGRPMASDWVSEFRLDRSGDDDWRSKILRTLHSWRDPNRQPIPKRYTFSYTPVDQTAAAGGAAEYNKK